MVGVQSVEPLRKIVHELVFRYSATFIFVHQSQQPSDTRIGHRISVFAETERRSGRNRDSDPRHDYRKELPSRARLPMNDDYFPASQRLLLTTTRSSRIGKCEGMPQIM
jgi:hypothetical protein